MRGALAEEQIRKRPLRIEVLDEKVRAIELTLTDPFLDPTLERT